MSTSLQQRLRARIAAPAFPWVTGGALTALAIAELEWFAPASPTVTIGVLASAASLMWLRMQPAVAFLAVAAAVVGFAADDNLYIVTIVSGLVGCYTLGRHRLQHPAVLVAEGALAALTANVIHILRWRSTYGEIFPAIRGGDWLSPGLFTEAFVLTVAIIGAVSMGDAVRARAESRRERAAAQARLIAMERRQAAEAERAAMARELHDVVAHSVSVIAVQAEGATYTTADLSPQAREGFQQIAASARASLSELRRLLGVLRTEGDRAETAPQPTLDGLEDLLEQHIAVGGEAELRIDGERVTLPTSWELSAYRIVQEALTNARRHAPGARTVVDIGYLPDRLRLRIADDGPGPADGIHTGHGLVGMRERAVLLGGALTAGRGPDGGFLVEADLPL